MSTERVLNRTGVLAAVGVGGAALAAAMAIRVLAELFDRAGGEVTRPEMLFEGGVMIALLLALTLWFRRLQIGARAGARRVEATALSRLDLRRVANELGLIRVAFIVAFTCLILTFQLASTMRVRPFPFTHWSMYTRRAPSLDYSQFIAEFESGRVAHYPFVLIQRTSPRSFMSRFKLMLDTTLDPSRAGAHDADLSPEQVRDEARTNLTEAMRILAEIHDRRYPEDRIVAMEAARMTVIGDAYGGPESVRRELAVRVEFNLP